MFHSIAVNRPETHNMVNLLLVFWGWLGNVHVMTQTHTHTHMGTKRSTIKWKPTQTNGANTFKINRVNRRIDTPYRKVINPNMIKMKTSKLIYTIFCENHMTKSTSIINAIYRHKSYTCMVHKLEEGVPVYNLGGLSEPE